MQRLLSDLRSYFPVLFPVLCGLAVANSFMEGMVVLLLLPFFRVLSGQELTGQEDPISGLAVYFLNFFNIDVEPLYLVFIIIGVALIQYSVFLGLTWVFADLQARYRSILRKTLFEKLAGAKLSFFSEEKVGEFGNTLMLEVDRASGALVLFIQLVTALITCTIYLGLALLLSWRVTLLLIACAAAIGCVGFVFLGHTRKIGRALSRHGNELTSWAGEVFAGIKLFKASASESVAIRQFDQIVDKMEGHYHAVFFQPNLVRSGFELATIGGLLTSLYIASTIFGVDFSTQIVVIGIVVRLYPRLSALQQSLQSMHFYLPAVVQIHELADRAEGAIEASENIKRVTKLSKDRKRPERRAAHVRVENLSVYYEGESALNGVSVDIPAEAAVAIVGPSGAGKTTLVDTIMGLVEANRGQILIDGRPLDSNWVREWRRRVAYVTQETIVFNASIRDNIAWSRPDATDKEIVDAARKAHCDDFIRRMPEGYDTIVGDRGMRLSGGQRQRIGIARALLTQKSLLILDEATSALDSEIERQIMETIEGLKGKITTLLVAHRLSTLRHADHIYVLENGRLVEHGSWSELIKAEGIFANLWTMQSGVPS